MKLDMDLFRDLLIYFEENCSYKNGVSIEDISIKNFSKEEISYHIELLLDEKLIIALDQTSLSDPYRYFYIERLTYDGHQFLSALKNDTVWNKVKSTSMEIGVEAVKAIIPSLVLYVKTQLNII